MTRLPRAPALAAALAIAACLAGALSAPAPGASATPATLAAPPHRPLVPAPRASLPAIERRVMCVTCKIPLLVAQSPQADRERAYIRALIAQSLTQAQIERALVGQYGPAALALPRARGFDLAVYLVPIAAILALAAALALLLPRWRRRSRVRGPEGAEGADTTPPPALAPSDSARLDADLARFDT